LPIVYSFVFLLCRLRLATLESEKEEMLHEVRQLRKMGQTGDLPCDMVCHRFPLFSEVIRGSLFCGLSLTILFLSSKMITVSVNSLQFRVH